MVSFRRTKCSTPRVCRRSRCRLEIDTLPYLSGSPGRQGLKVTRTRSSSNRNFFQRFGGTMASATNYRRRRPLEKRATTRNAPQQRVLEYFPQVEKSRNPAITDRGKPVLKVVQISTSPQRSRFDPFEQLLAVLRQNLSGSPNT